MAGAFVPIATLAGWPEWIHAGLGAAVVIAEGIAQLTQVHGHWVWSRRTAESIRVEALRFVAHIAPYGEGERRTELLAARLVDLLSQEQEGWEESVRLATSDAQSA